MNNKLKSLLKTKSIRQYSNEDVSRLFNYITKLEKENKKLKEGIIKSIRNKDIILFINSLDIPIISIISSLEYFL